VASQQQHQQQQQLQPQSPKAPVPTLAPAFTWNDASLRTFFDSSDDVRDLLVVVYEQPDIHSAGEHPVVGSLFREQNAKLAEITTVSLFNIRRRVCGRCGHVGLVTDTLYLCVFVQQLDNMLGDWLSRKQRIRTGR